MKIFKYKTAKGSSAQELDREVNNLIGQGYVPFGNPYLSDDEIGGIADTFKMFQAMVMDLKTAGQLKKAGIEAKNRKFKKGK